MANNSPTKLRLPVEPYTTGDLRVFGQRLRRRIILWATHLGDDVVVASGTAVRAIGAGDVVWSEVRLGTKEHRNWGGVVIVRHTTFYSIYGHMTALQVKTGDHIQGGQQLGVVAPGGTAENGWWATPHLHFAIYTGPWRDSILPGYARPDDWLRLSPRRTRLAWWHNPRQFIEDYESGN